MLNSEFFINSIFFQYSLMIVNIIKIKNYNFSFFNFFFVKKIKLFSLRNCQLNQSLYFMYLIILNFLKKG